MARAHGRARGECRVTKLQHGVVVRRLMLWLPPLVYMAAIFLVSAARDPLPTVSRTVWDKLLHVVEYAGLAVLLARGFAGERRSPRVALGLAIVVASAYAASDEWHQWFVPGRSSDVRDWIADTIGAILGAALYVSGGWSLRRVRRGAV